jgi:hypothetical protein
MGSSVATVSINIKEAPAITFNLQSVLKEDAETGLYTPTGRDWETLPAVTSGTEVISGIAGDVNARKLLIIKTNPSTTRSQRTLHIFHPDGGTWSRVDASQGVPLYGSWNSVAASADASVLVAVGGATSSTNTDLDTPGKIVLSADGGVTWQTQSIPASGPWAGLDVAISADGNSIYIATYKHNLNGGYNNESQGALFASHNRGLTWATLTPSGSFAPVEGVSCDASGNVVVVKAVGNGFNNLIVSTDKGASWINRNTTTGRYWEEVEVTADGKSIFAKESDFSHLHVSKDLGATWRDTYSGPHGYDTADNCYGFTFSSTGMRVAQFNGYNRFIMSDDAAQTFVGYPFTPNASQDVRLLIANHSGRRLITAHRSNVYVSQGGGIEIEHAKGDSQVLTVTLGAPQGLLRVTALEGVIVTGNGTGNLSLTGSLGLINAILESLTYQGGADFTGAAGFTVTASASGVSNTQTNELTIQDAAQPEMAVQATSSAITETSAILDGTVLGNGGSALTRRGVVISPTSANPSPVRGGNNVIDLAARGVTAEWPLGSFGAVATGLLPSTSYSFRAYAANANGPQYSEIGTFTTLGGTPGESPAASWRLQYFGTTENSGNAANLATPDGDGIANIIKYALGLTPGQSSSHLLPRPSFSNEGDQRHLSIRFKRVPARDDVTITVEALSDLGGSWTELARSTRGAAIQGSGGIAETPNSNGTVDCEVRDTVEIDQAAKRFMRVRVIAE